jgi:hypothetical protein
MFSELPKLFDRNFAIAYFLPVNLFLVASWFLLDKIGLWSQISSRLSGNPVLDVTIIAFFAWIVGILLLVLNRDIYRILEGYGKYNPFHILFDQRAKKEFSQKKTRLDQLDEQLENDGDAFPADLQAERADLISELAQNYPDDVSFVLPTPFGNVLRAFEIYPRVMYGYEGIDGWIRIQAVTPKDYRELIDDAKAQVDWWVNLGVLSLAYLFEFWIAVFYKYGLHQAWYITVLNILVPLALFALLSWLVAWRATSAAIGWGDYVKSAFDLYRFNLIELLGIKAPQSRAQEKSIWQSFSQAILFRREDLLPALKKSTPKRKKSQSSAKDTAGK